METSTLTSTLTLTLCQAITTNGKPCKKKRTKQSCFCNTHLSVGRSVPSSSSSSSSDLSSPATIPPPGKKTTAKTTEVEIREIRGIPYYIDANHRVYKHEEIHQDQPSVIGHYNVATGCIDFVMTLN